MKRSVLLAFLCMSFIPIFSQTSIGQEAQALREEGKLLEAISVYQRGIKEAPNDKGHLYDIACAYALLKNRDSAFHYLEMYLPFDSTAWPMCDADLYFLSQDDRWEGIVDQQLAKVEDRHMKYKNPALAKELWAMRRSDQAFYYQNTVAKKQMGNSNPITPALWHLKHKINEKNQMRLIEIIEEHGWPKQSEVGGMGASAAFLVIQHASLELQEKYIPMIETACKEGEARWESYALMYDRIQTRNGKPQRYGSQVRYDPEKNINEPFEIEDPEYVNKRRAEVGLGPIEEYLVRWNIEWTVPQK